MYKFCINLATESQETVKIEYILTRRISHSIVSEPNNVLRQVLSNLICRSMVTGQMKTYLSIHELVGHPDLLQMFQLSVYLLKLYVRRTLLFQLCQGRCNFLLQNLKENSCTVVRLYT